MEDKKLYTIFFLQARIPRSPLSVAQELLPNFPSNLVQQYGYSSPQQQLQQYQMSLQQRLQQQFQHQLQLNLQGGGESSGPVMPEPPDTILDVDLPAGGSGEGNFGSSQMNSSSNNSGLRSQFLEALLRSAQAASSHQRSTNDLGGLLSRGASGHSNSQNHGHHHHHHHHSHNYESNESGGSGHFSSSSNGSGHGGSDVGMVPHGAGIGPAGTGVGPSGPARSDSGQPIGGIQQGAELTLLYKWIAESGIFMILLLLHFLYDHRLGKSVLSFFVNILRLMHSFSFRALCKIHRWLSQCINVFIALI